MKADNLFSKFIVFFVITLNTIFAFTTLYVFYHTKNEPSVLIGAWFAFTTGELWALAFIKTKKINKNCQ